MLAAAWRAKLVVFHVMQRREPETDLPSWRRADPLEAARQRVRSDLAGIEGVALEVLVDRGDPGDAILAAAARLDVDLIVTGVARDELLGRFSIGATVEKLVREAAVPVLTVKSRPRRPYVKLVVATDFSAGSRDAVEAALALWPDATLRLFHAFDVTLEGFMGDKMAARRAAAGRAADECRAFVAATPAAQGRQDLDLLCEYGDPATLLADFAAAGGAELVVVGSHGRSGLKRILIGNDAQRILAWSPVDVMIVRRPEGAAS